MEASFVLQQIASRLDLVVFARTYLRILPDEKQAKVLRSLAPQLILNCSRQWDKSTVSSILASH